MKKIFIIVFFIFISINNILNGYYHWHSNLTKKPVKTFVNYSAAGAACNDEEVILQPGERRDLGKGGCWFTYVAAQGDFINTQSGGLKHYISNTATNHLTVYYASCENENNEESLIIENS